LRVFVRGGQSPRLTPALKCRLHILEPSEFRFQTSVRS
jgi:hypothetical protein